MPDPVAQFIPTRSKRQALDWSLVLASQGLDSVILPPDENHGWALSVADKDYASAIQSLRLYRSENPPRRWHPPMAWTGLLLDSRAAVWCVLLVAIFTMDHTRWPYLHAAGMMDGPAVLEGAWHRLFTAVTLHADAGHLAANATTGFVLIGMAMGAYGFGWGFLASYLSGAGGNLIALWLHTPPLYSLGASGMVMGALGLLAVHSAAVYRSDPNRSRLVGRGFLGALCLLVILGLDPQADVIAHVGGFATGTVLGLGLHLAPHHWKSRHRPNRIAEAIGASLMVATWWLALR